MCVCECVRQQYITLRSSQCAGTDAAQYNSTVILVTSPLSLQDYCLINIHIKNACGSVCVCAGSELGGVWRLCHVVSKSYDERERGGGGERDKGTHPETRTGVRGGRRGGVSRGEEYCQL